MSDGPQVRSYGAAMTVTGSCHLLDTGTTNVLVDCGAFQGSAALGDLNHEPFGFDLAAIDAVLLTHAHMDHAARLPLLAARQAAEMMERGGVEGKIVHHAGT